MLSMQIHFPSLAGATNVIRRKIRPMVACKEKGTHMRGIVKEIFKHTHYTACKENGTHMRGIVKETFKHVCIYTACRKKNTRTSRKEKGHQQDHVVRLEARSFWLLR